MATVLSLNIPDPLLPRLSKALKAANPEWTALTDAAVVKGALKEYLTSRLAAFEGAVDEAAVRAASEAAAKQARSDAGAIS